MHLFLKNICFINGKLFSGKPLESRFKTVVALSLQIDYLDFYCGFCHMKNCKMQDVLQASLKYK